LKISSIPEKIPENFLEKISGLHELEDIGQIIGQGTSGVVKKMFHSPSKKFFALKIIPLDVTEEVRKKILQELRTLYLAEHDSIVEFYGAFYSEGLVSIVLEYMDGGTLAHILQKINCIPEEIIAQISKKLLSGLHYIHKQLHIIHRDIKPTNILVNSKGEVKITDFGVVGKLNNTVGLARTFTGTVPYMSPERIEGKDHMNNSDIWSMGLTMLECAKGYYPFCPPCNQNEKGLPPLTFWELLHRVRTCPIPNPPQPPQFSEEFCSFSALCLEKRYSDRPSAEDLLAHPFILKAAIYQNQKSLKQWVVETLNLIGTIPKT